MKVPQVVIVGRPNVGKSSIFNWLAGRRLAIVDDMAGVTRDRMTHLLEADGRFVELVDTGGIGIDDADNLTEQVEEKITTAIDPIPRRSIRRPTNSIGWAAASCSPAAPRRTAIGTYCWK
jgi:small GTP-binding protein